MTDVRKPSDAFPVLQLTRTEPAKACEAYIAVYRSKDRPDVAIAAATPDDLARRWKSFTGMDLDRAGLQRVVITAWRPSDAAL